MKSDFNRIDRLKIKVQPKADHAQAETDESALDRSRVAYVYEHAKHSYHALGKELADAIEAVDPELPSNRQYQMFTTEPGISVQLGSEIAHVSYSQQGVDFDRISLHIAFYRRESNSDAFGHPEMAELSAHPREEFSYEPWVDRDMLLLKWLSGTTAYEIPQLVDFILTKLMDRQSGNPTQ